MALHPQLKELLELPSEPDPEDPIQLREAFAASLAAIDKPGPQMAEEISMTIPTEAGIRNARLFRPEGVTADAPLVVFVHGGGWNKGSIETHASLCRILADAGRFGILSCDYRLMPEFRYPSAYEDTLACIRFAADKAGDLGFESSKLGLAGDSAGGNLVAAAALALSETGGIDLAGLLLLYPVLDMVNVTPSRKEFGKGYWLDTLPALIEAYIPEPSARHELTASPLLSDDLGKMPPTLTAAAGFDPLRDEARAFDEKLRSAGVRSELLLYDDMIHGFLSLHGLVTDAAEYGKQIGDAFGKLLRGS